MGLWFTACKQWVRSTLTWSNSRQSWQERLGVGALVIAGLLLFLLSGRLTLAQQVVLWTVLIVALAGMLRRGWVKLFGPVLFYDLVRVGRRSRYILIRAVYVSFLLLILVWIWWLWSLDYRYQNSSRAPLKIMAEFAERQFFTFMIVQLVLTVILTPAYVAGAIAEEKDRKTLEFLLATDLRNREIVLSKMVARLANLLLIALAGLPVVSALLFFGGIDPDLLMASFAATALIMISLSGVSTLCSVQARKPRDAIVLTYLIVASYQLVSFASFLLLKWLQHTYPEIANWSPDLDWLPWVKEPVTLTIEDPVNWLTAGDLFISLGRIVEGLETNRSLADTLPGLLRNFAIFHLFVALICSTLAVMRVRRVALKEAYGRTHKLSLGWQLWGRPAIGDQPMLWKEIFAEPGLRLKWMGKLAVGLLVLLSFVPIMFIFIEVMSRSSWRDPYKDLGEGMNIYVRFVGTIVACLTLLAVAVRAAGSLSGERDKQTFDGLLTTPMDASSILLAKWIGSIVSIRWAWLWLGFIWMLGAMSGGLQVMAIPFLIASWLVYAGIFACIGMWFSLNCRTSLRATMWTLLVTIFLGGGHWIASGFCCFLPLAATRTFSSNDTEYLAKFLWGQTPPLVLGLLAFHGEEFTKNYIWNDMAELLGFSILGLGSWSVGGLILGTVLHQRFQELTLRQAVRRPERYGQPRPAELTLPATKEPVPAELVPDEELPMALQVEDEPATSQHVTPAPPGPLRSDQD